MFVGIDVTQVGVERVDALLEPRFHFVEFVGFDDARHRIVREQPVVVFTVFIDAEAYAVTAQLAIDGFPAIDQFRRQFTCSRFDHLSTLLHTPNNACQSSGPCRSRSDGNGCRLPKTTRNCYIHVSATDRLNPRNTIVTTTPIHRPEQLLRHKVRFARIVSARIAN